MDEVFPRFAETPEELSVHHQQMVIWLENAVVHDLKKNVSDIKQYIDNHNNEIDENGLDEISAFVWGYNLCRPWWLYRHGLDRALPQDCVDYAAELDANDDQVSWRIVVPKFR
ncbi:hypothetical protein F2Q69_00059836 [Brassica cretica]|uniref:Uncharacterized protein n=1 Tax=Brassica cretica TaxID=69181 RepID=A0A8S9RF23_BRACR|nr:hypothetical protein F2Q69_00059836 [Brassica cretica]